MSAPSQIKVSIIGSGKVARNLAHALTNHHIPVNEIFSRTKEKAALLCQEIPKAKPTDSLDFTTSSSSVFIIAVSDDAIAEVVLNCKIPSEAIIAHTSGTTSMSSLSNAGEHFGIFYPLQTFTKDLQVDFSQLPLLIDGNKRKTIDMLLQLGNTISQNVSIASDSERQQLHVAAVFASNFTNRMLAASEEILKGTNIKFEALKPLVNQTILNVFENGPDKALTGPAIRNDQSTINKHLDLLGPHSNWQDIYRRLTDDIIKKSKK